MSFLPSAPPTLRCWVSYGGVRKKNLLLLFSNPRNVPPMDDICDYGASDGSHAAAGGADTRAPQCRKKKCFFSLFFCHASVPPLLVAPPTPDNSNTNNSLLKISHHSSLVAHLDWLLLRPSFLPRFPAFFSNSSLSCTHTHTLVLSSFLWFCLKLRPLHFSVRIISLLQNLSATAATFLVCENQSV